MEHKLTEGKEWFLSIDLGKKNFCIYIEEIDIHDLRKYKIDIDIKSRYNPDGTASSEMQKVINDICMNGKKILHENIDLTYNTDSKKYLDKEIFYNMIEQLEKYKDYFDNCSHIVIEQQLQRNSMAVRLGQHCYSYFLIKYGKTKDILEFPSYYKTTILGAQKVKGKVFKNGNFRWKSMTQRDRKKWAISKAISILHDRGDIDHMEFIKKSKKADDYSDTICQLSAYKIKYFVLVNE
jgi:hypothetical protein